MKSPFLLKLAYWCWGVSLSFALISLFGFWITRSDFFLSTGIFTLIIGFTLTCTGLILISVLRFKNRKEDQDLLKQIKKGVFLPRLLLFSNFPVAFIFLFVGIHLQSLIYLHISNEGTKNINQIIISSPLNKKILGSLKVGDTIKTSFSPKVQGEVLISIQSGESKKTTEITDYASGNFDDSKVVIKNDLVIDILRLRKIKDEKT